MPPALPPRKFAPTPVETTSKSSRKTPPEKEVKHDASKPRKFAPEPVETSSKNSKDKKEEAMKPRRFAPEPVEQSTKSSKDKREEGKPKMKFSVQPLETSTRSNRKAKDDDEPRSPGSTMPEKPKARRFAPQLLDTATRTRKAGDKSADDRHAFKTESGHHIHAHEHRKAITGEPAVVGEGYGGMVLEHNGESGHATASHHLLFSSELRKERSPADGRPTSRSSFRSHSFRCPDLDTIESSESERESTSSSLSTSPAEGSPLTTSDTSFDQVYKHATRIRESVDENFGHYLLQLEARKAEQRLQEQALAAFPNSDFHEPVQHYVGEDEGSDDMDIDDRPATWDGHDEDLFMDIRRRESTKGNWEQEEMQRHAEKLEQERNAAKTTAKQPTMSPSPWWNPGSTLPTQPDNELSSMRDRARPPMLGMDLTFPRCPSPEPARFDVTQGSTTLRNQMCYLTEAAEQSMKLSEEEAGLWHAPETPENKRVSTWQSPNHSARSTQDKGLWGGFCFGSGEEPTPSGLAPPSGPTGLMTPMLENVNPFEQSLVVPRGPGIMTPPTPPMSLSGGLGRLDSILVDERELDELMERDYPDSFITQVYNYLSLGYPSLARPFDEELAKISRVSISELRQDDKKARTLPRGYIRLGPDFEGGGGEGVSEEDCKRWQALKRYVREWARQEKGMVRSDGPGGNWGTGARRGSWAI